MYSRITSTEVIKQSAASKRVSNDWLITGGFPDVVIKDWQNMRVIRVLEKVDSISELVGGMSVSPKFPR